MSRPDPRPNRRKFLVATAGIVALAGCADEDEGTPAPEANGEDTPEDGEATPEETPEETPEDEETPTEEEGTPEDGEGGSTVEALAVEFDPALVEVEAGGTVVFENVEGSHTVTYYHEEEGRQHRVPEGVEHVNEELPEGETVEVTFEEEGVYDYYCQPHEGVGMVGSVIVGQNDDPDQPGLSEPGDDIPDDAAQRLQELNEEARSQLGM